MAATASVYGLQGGQPVRRSATPAAPEPRQRVRGRTAAVARVLVMLGILLASATQPARTATSLVLLGQHMLPEPPTDPLTWVSAPPREEQFSYVSQAGQVESDLYLPATAGAHPAVVVSTGVFATRREPDLVRFADGMARSGVVVMVPESASLRAGDLVPEEIDTLVLAVDYLRRRPEVDPTRLGMFGFSVGGALVLLAAEHDSLRDQIAFVHVSGAYFDARELLREVVTQRLDVEGQTVIWNPDHVTEYTLFRQLIGAMPYGRDRSLLWRAVLDNEPISAAELASISADARYILELREHPPRERVDEILEALPAASRARLDAISPSHRISEMRARLYVLHGRSDDVIAYTQSRYLAKEVPPSVLRCYTESGLFEHVSPDTGPTLVTFLRDYPGMARHAWLIGNEML